MSEIRRHPASPRSRAERRAEMMAQAAVLPDVPGQPAVEPKPATARMHELAELRRLQGVIVPMPGGLAERAARYSPDEKDPAVIAANRATVQDTLAWLGEIARQGGGQDVDAAWYRLPAKKLKNSLRNDYSRLRLQAERTYIRLAEAAMAEAAAERREWQRRQDALNLKKQIEADEKALAAKKRRLIETMV